MTQGSCSSVLIIYLLKNCSLKARQLCGFMLETNFNLSLKPCIQIKIWGFPRIHLFVFHIYDLTRNYFPGMYSVLPWECSCPKGGIIWSVINRWSDYIGLDRDNCHVGILSTIPQHFTHNETQWPTAAHRCHFALRDVSVRQSWHLWTRPGYFYWETVLFQTTILKWDYFSKFSD